MKMVMETYSVAETCKLCLKIEAKLRNIEKQEKNIKRWQKEGGRSHSIIKANEEIEALGNELWALEQQKEENRFSTR